MYNLQNQLIKIITHSFRSFVGWKSTTEKFKIKKSNLEEFENELDNYQKGYKSND